MPLPPDPDVPTWKFIAIGAWTAITILFSWFAKTLRDEQKEQRTSIVAAHTRLDDTVSKVDFKEALGTFRIERDAQHKDNREERVRLHGETLGNFKELAAKLDKQAVHEVRILECERDIGVLKKYTEDLKHIHVDPYTRATDILKSRVDRIEDQCNRG